MKSLILLAIFCCAVSHAASIKDIQVLDLIEGDPNLYKFKVHSREGKPNSYFFVAFEKKNLTEIDQLKYFLQKLTRPEKFRLDFEIASFSPYPNGSFYRASSVKMTHHP